MAKIDMTIASRGFRKNWSNGVFFGMGKKFAVTLGPLMEELFFRGLLYPVLVRRMGIFWGIVLTALPFGLLHMFQYGYSWAVVLLIFLMGTVCTIVRWKTESVAASFLVHVGYNGTEMFMLMLATDGFRHMEKVLR